MSEHSYSVSSLPVMLTMPVINLFGTGAFLGRVATV